MAAIAVGEDVDGHQLMMEVDGDLVGIARAGLDLGGDVAHQLLQVLAQGPPVLAADIGDHLARLARPAPDAAEHAPVQLEQAVGIEHVEARAPRPTEAGGDIVPLGPVQVVTGDDIGRDQRLAVLRREDRGAVVGPVQVVVVGHRRHSSRGSSSSAMKRFRRSSSSSSKVAWSSSAMVCATRPSSRRATRVAAAS